MQKGHLEYEYNWILDTISQLIIMSKEDKIMKLVKVDLLQQKEALVHGRVSYSGGKISIYSKDANKWYIRMVKKFLAVQAEANEWNIVKGVSAETGREYIDHIEANISDDDFEMLMTAMDKAIEDAKERLADK